MFKILFLYSNKSKILPTNLNLKHFSTKNNPDLKSTMKKTKIEKEKEETLVLFSHESAARYYKLNVLSLLAYNTVLGLCLKSPEFPDYIRGTMTLSFGLISIAIICIGIFSKRHISSISITKPSNILLVKTFSKFGLFNSYNSYQIPLKEIKELVPVSDYIKTRKTGIYILKTTENTKYHNFFNFFFIRPTNNNHLFDQYFKSKVRSRKN